MKILFVTTTLPFPPRQGIELPNAHILVGLADYHDIDILVLGNTQDFEQRKANVPSSLKKIFHLSLKKQNRFLAIVRELLGRQPLYFVDGFKYEDVIEQFQNRHYDLVWAAPVGVLGFVKYCKKIGLKLSNYVAVGLNDATTTIYLGSLKKLLSSRIGWDKESFFRGIRVPWVWFYERQYLREVDIVHVQTSLERIRVDKIIGKRDSKPEIVVAQNGRKTELENVRYQGHNSKRILLMTHLDGGRAREAKWFIEKVWPLITVIEPEASLLLVGRPPKTGSTKERELRSNKNVKVLGFVDDFGKFLESISIMVVPTLHGTGLVNRVLDALCAGIPIVACPEPLSTITGLIPGKHALSGSNAKEFAEGVLTLLSDPTLRKSLSSEGRKLAKTQPTWHETIERIDMTIRTIGEDCTL